MSLNVAPSNQQVSKVSQTKQKQKRNIKGGLLALGAGSIASVVSLPIGLLAGKGLVRPSKTLTKDQIELVNKGAETVLNQLTNLPEKGVQIIHIDEKDFVKTSNIMEKIFYNGTNQVAKGKNAFFTGGINVVTVNQKKLPLPVFHELGHAFNWNNSNFWKQMQKMRLPAMSLISIFAFIPAITKNHEAKEGEKLTGRQKFVNGLRNASPILAGLSLMPMVLEEGMATLRANKWAKDIFKDTPELAKKVAKTNKWGFISYSATMLATAFGVWVSKKVKDASDEKLSQKNALGSKPFLEKPSNNVKSHQG